ncbi:mechanosensitive ion channel family protein [Thalassotalea euphylliae]|uniref:Small-conductance mechanosensitive channel n=1 Tax=Thalassotalea euphylliae TaxID=1655234 RepID=A0A3E0UK69_9GAMM|nr:mechanosensitive ion channel family protein [Thalassotalea euphylliae]REL37331.1 mechanosensitive ion channel protein MscS [Thalassotalea euphylliae]
MLTTHALAIPLEQTNAQSNKQVNNLASEQVTEQENELPADSSQQSKIPVQSTKLALEIEALKAELIALTESLGQAKGDDFSAIQLQLFHKNLELRRDIDEAIKSETIPIDALQELVRSQVQYVESAINFLNTKIQDVSENLSNAPAEQRLLVLNSFGELQALIDLIYQWSAENITWLNALKVVTVNAQGNFNVKLQGRIRMLAASINYYHRQRQVLQQQISASPLSEKANLEVSLLAVSQRLTIALKSLKAMIKLAKNAGIETSQYQQLMFESTGELTYEILDFKVLGGIFANLGEKFVNWLMNNGVQYLFKLLIFVFIVFIASKLAKLTAVAVHRATSAKQVNMSRLMKDFFVNMSGKVVLIIGIMIGLSQIGIDITPVLAGFGIASIIIGFALQDTLSNLASGMMLLIYKPFDEGDFVYAGGVNGKVSHMSLVNTTIRTFDNQIIIIPNSKIWGDVIKNVTQERIRRVDMVFGIGYKDDLLKAEQVLTEIVASHPNVLKSPETIIKVNTLNTSSVDFIVRPWVKTDFYWDVYWDITKEVKLRFDREGISIPFPQQDVHLHMAEPESSTIAQVPKT